MGIGPLLQLPNPPRASPVLLTLLLFPPSSFVILSFAWFCIFFSTAQILLSVLIWCSACTSVSDSVFLMYLWREIYSMSTYSSAILFSPCPILYDPMHCCTPGFPVHHNSWSLLKLMSIESVIPSNHLILCRPLLLRPSIFPSIRVFSNEPVLCIRGPKYWSFSFSINPSIEYSGMMSFRIDWLDILAVQGTLKVFYNTTVQKHHFFNIQFSL